MVAQRRVSGILKDSVRPEVNSTTITAAGAVPACWTAQIKAMLPAQMIS
jgi:hypothetical protein